MIPVIDLFAGPGGLGEGFSSVYYNGKPCFDIKLSIEKDASAHKTLKLRSFYRQFKKRGESAPAEYYQLLEETDLPKREQKLEELYKKYPEGKLAAKEAVCLELGLETRLQTDQLIKDALGIKTKDWVLIGGPPCQAYSLIGRSRVGGVREDDHRVYLYKEYLRIIAYHQPSVFIMENVKGLLSATLNGEKVFKHIIKDLTNPSIVFGETNSARYKIYSLVTKDVKEDKDYLIKAEEYCIPQKRHRVILLGIREDVKSEPTTLVKSDKYLTVASVIGCMPPLRSRLSKSINTSSDKKEGKKRGYDKIVDSAKEWIDSLAKIRREVYSLNGFAGDDLNEQLLVPKDNFGKEFIQCSKTIAKDHSLHDWYIDPNLTGVINHESRAHLLQDLKRYFFSAVYCHKYSRFPRLEHFEAHSKDLLPNHNNALSGKFNDRFRVQLPNQPATTVTSHISKDGHYFIHYDHKQCRSFTVREAARIQTFPDNYLFCGGRTHQFHQVGNAVPPYLAMQIGEVVRDLLH